MRFLVFVCLMMVLFSCQKESFLNTEISSPESSDIINDQFGFLSLESRVQEVSGRFSQDYVTVYRKSVLDLHAELVKQNNQYDFVDDIATKIGLPDWEHSITMRSPNNDRLTFVPLVNSLGTTSSRITGVLGATQMQEDFNIFAYDIEMLGSPECKYRNKFVAASIVSVFEDRYNQLQVEMMESGIDPCYCEESDILDVDIDCFERQIQFCAYEGESWAGSNYMAPPWIDHDHDGVPNDEDQDYEEFYRRYIEPYLQQNPSGDFWAWVENRWNNSEMYEVYGDFQNYWSGYYYSGHDYVFFYDGQEWQDFLRDLNSFWDTIGEGLGSAWGGFVDGLSWFFWDWWHDPDPCPDGQGLGNPKGGNQNNESQDEIVARSSIQCIDITFEDCGNSDNNWWELLLNSSFQGSSANLQAITSLWQNHYSDIIDLQALWVISKDCDPNGQGGQVGFEQCVQLKVQEHALAVYSEHVDLFHSYYSPSQKIGITNWLINNSNCLLPFSYDPQGGFAQCLNDQLSALSFYQNVFPDESFEVEGILSVLDEYGFLSSTSQNVYDVIDGITQLYSSGQLESESAYRSTFPMIDYEEYAATVALLVAIKKHEDPHWCTQPSWSCEFDKYIIGFKALLAAQTEYLHLTFDICGLVPVGGIFCDIANGVLYTIEGDGFNASLSILGVLPIIGEVAVGTKLYRTYKTGNNAFKLTYVVGDQLYTFGSRGKLSRLLKPAGNEQCHHIITWANNSHEIIQKAAQAGWHPSHIKNGINLDKSIHNGYDAAHQVYSANLTNYLDGLDPFMDPDIAKNTLESLQTSIRSQLEQGKLLNEISFP